MDEKRIISWLVATRIMDGVTTYISTPDLSYEVNPLVRHLGFGWLGLIVSGTIFLIVVIALFKDCYKRIGIFNIKANSFQEYISYYFYNTKIKPFQFLYRIPIPNRFYIFIGYLFPLFLIYYSMYLIINNLLMYWVEQSDQLTRLYDEKFGWIQYYLVFLVPFFIIGLISYRHLNKMYREANSENEK